MNRSQELWWQQAKSDHDIFLLLRQQGVAQCHILHYLQMVTEKLAKAYFWREESPPSKNHAAFVQFLRFLGQIRPADRERIAKLFSFSRFSDFQNWLRMILPMAYELERIAPALANDGPNSEYPWPYEQPRFSPCTHQFAIWAQLNLGQGRDLMRIVHIAVDRFPQYADS